ncbi:MAG: KH domain-containing protein [Bacteroidetes bacterium]|nr:KH domain-containing protein [Bacteroidota bacterium]MCH7770573.1 KH domain-containing protein [Bacteroidota bacterium]
MKELIEFIAKLLVDKPDNVIVEETTPDENTIELTLKVDKSDIGKVIGKYGRNVNAIRILLTAVGAKEHHRATLQILE